MPAHHPRRRVTPPRLLLRHAHKRTASGNRCCSDATAICTGVTGAEGQPVRRHHRSRRHNSHIRHEQTPIKYHRAQDAPGALNLQPPPRRKHRLTNKPGTRNGDDARAPSPPAGHSPAPTPPPCMYMVQVVSRAWLAHYLHGRHRSRGSTGPPAPPRPETQQSHQA